MHRLSTRLAALLLLTCCAGVSLAEPAKFLHLRKHTLKDPKAGNIASHTLFVPDKWKVTGGAFWANPKLYKVLPSQAITVTAPDGTEVSVAPSLAMFDFLPSQAGMQGGLRRPEHGSAVEGRIAMPYPATAGEWDDLLTKKLIPLGYPKAKNLEVRVTRLKELDPVIDKQLAMLRMSLAQRNRFTVPNGLRGFCDCHAYAVFAEYTEDGVQMEHVEVFYALTVGTESPFGTAHYWAVVEPRLFRAPKGKLSPKLPLLATVAKSVRTTQRWKKMVFDLQNKLREQDLAHAKAMFDIHQNSIRIQNRINDRQHERFIRHLRDVDLYKLDDETSVELPSGFKRVFFDGTDNLLLTNNLLLDPGSSVTTTGTWREVSIIDR